MSWSSPDSWLTRLFSGDPIIIAIAFLVSISLPILVHLYIYATATKLPPTPLFVLLGPTGSGKTALLTLLQSQLVPSPGNRPVAVPSRTLSRPLSPTRTSQIPSTPVKLELSASIPRASNKYRSVNDDSSLTSAPYQLIDTPGHGKLRNAIALTYLSDPALQGLIFVVDSAALDSVVTSDTSSLREAASYLHDVLLALQRRNNTISKSKSKALSSVSLLIAANKQDLFVALPPGAVRERLESEIDRVRSSRTRGLVTVGESGEEEPEEALGGDVEEKFSFKILKEDFGMSVDVLGGSVDGEEAGKGLRRWEEWIGSCL